MRNRNLTFLLTGALSLSCNSMPNLFQCPPSADHGWIDEGKLLDVYVLGLEYDRGTVRQTDFYLTQVYFYEEKEQPSDGYRAVLFNENQQPIFERRFKFPLISVSEGFPHIGIENKGEVELYIPFREDAKRIDIYDKSCRRISVK